MAPVTFYDFKHLPGYPSTFELPLKEGHALHLVKFDEDAQEGYGYAISILIGGKEAATFSGYYSGFGMEDHPDDVIHAIRNYLSLTGYRS